MTNPNNLSNFTGRLTRDVLIQAHKPNSDGVVVSATAIFTVAVQDNFESTNSKGKKEKRTQFIPLNTFVNEQSKIEQYEQLSIGDLVNIVAHFESNEKNGVYYQNIVLDQIKALEPKSVRAARKDKRAVEAPIKEAIGLNIH